MSGRTNSDTEPVIAEDSQAGHDTDGAEGAEATEATEDAEDAEAAEEYAGDARQARWVAAGTGALLCLAGLAAALLRLTGSAPARVPAAYALGAAVCALAAVLGSRGRTRRALWLLIAGVMVMALGDQFD
ncbi:hypothetical protein [Streptomyces cyanogenus]|uniref:Uncharacterized protein n=1 Tax=Streptomyces cyanogenus TaxID=80860 RepID=A0ABX7TYY0_STRCY|nr:hypothetical protein [Streptomyces cyanogenus]QTE01064.1 hypothetical protein S1361_27270 [Streptomyces cyanogenus]